MTPQYFSQPHMGQDKWVESILGQIVGTFVDIGCHHWCHISNSLYFERCGWRGVAVELDPKHQAEWTRNRTTPFVLGDATEINYRDLFDEHQLPELIDYLSIDLEPPELSLVALRRVMDSGRRFRTITFETDAYRCSTTQEPSRELLLSLGYTLVLEKAKQDDYWILENT